MNKFLIAILLTIAAYLLAFFITLSLDDYGVSFFITAAVLAVVYFIIGLVVDSEKPDLKQGFLISSGIVLLVGLSLCGGLIFSLG